MTENLKTAPRRENVELFIDRFAPKRPLLRVLELGCGKGVSAKYFGEHGYSYTGIDRPPLEVKDAYRPFGTFIAGNFCEALPPGPFDIIFEHGAFVCNGDDALRCAVALAHDALARGGLFMSIDLFASGDKRLELAPHFRSFTYAGLYKLFSVFEPLHLGLRPNQPTFDFVGRKR